MAAETISKIGERLARIEASHEFLARSIESDRELARAERVEMLRRQDATSDLVRELAAEIKSYKDQAAGALKAGAAFKALAVLGWSAVVGLMMFVGLYGHKIVAALTGSPVR